jgi:hypothetical protein
MRSRQWIMRRCEDGYKEVGCLGVITFLEEEEEAAAAAAVVSLSSFLSLRLSLQD